LGGRERELADGLTQRIAEAEEEVASIEDQLKAKRREASKAEIPELRNALLRESKNLAVQLREAKARIPRARGSQHRTQQR
jgi:hypothetical protein